MSGSSAPGSAATNGDPSSADSQAGGSNDENTQQAGATSDDSDSPGTDTGLVTSGDDQLLITAEDGPEESGGALAEECARDVYEGEPVEVNLYVLMDASGSMRAPLSLATEEDIKGDTIWDAVSGAMKDFVTAEESAGLNLALNVFPISTETSVCTDGDACVVGAGTENEQQFACVVGVCGDVLVAYGIISPCQANADCFLDGDTCVIPGKCNEEPTRFCAFDEHCREGDTCVPDNGARASGICPGLANCSTQAYEAPRLDKLVLPEDAGAFVGELDLVKPDGLGNTPTHIALEGAYARVDQWRLDEPDANSVVLLVTDGQPYGCDAAEDPTAICGPGSSCAATLEQMELARDNGLNTYVVGVVLEGDTVTPDTFERMATAGGTESPFLISTDDTTAANLLTALNDIRGEVVPCTFDLPVPNGGELDPQLVNVEVGAGDKPETVPFVPTAADCGTDGVGWYYDKNESGDLAGIELCEQSCEIAKSKAAVDIVLGCPKILKIK